jgi:hypothetical protein
MAQHESWKKRAEHAREPESFWDGKQQQLESLRAAPEMTTRLVKRRVCATGCTGEERAAKRRERGTSEERGIKRHFEQWDAMESASKKQCTEPQA